MKKYHKSFLVLLGSALLVLTGCNTMKGLGKDTERAGEKIQENASR
jgi:predicted small secreted protein